MFSGLCLRSLSVCASVRFRLKFLVKVVFDEVEVQSTSNVPHDMIFLILMPNYSFDPNFMVH